MRTAFTFAASAVASLVIASCAAPQVDMTALRKTIDDYNTASKESMMGGSYEKALAYYEDDAMEMAPNMDMMKGKEAIKAFQAQMMKSGMKITAVSFNPVDLLAGGTLATEIGTYEMTITGTPMGEMKDHGKYVAIWHQQADGSWKVHAETWNTDVPMPSMEPNKEEAAKKEGMKKKM